MTSKVMVRFRVEVMIMGSRGNDSSFVKFNKKAALKGSGRELPGQLKKKGGPGSNPKVQYVPNQRKTFVRPSFCSMRSAFH